MLKPRGRHTESTLGLGPWNQPFKRGHSGSLGTLPSTSFLFPRFDVLPTSSLGKTQQAQWRPEGELSSEVLLALSDQ